MAAVLAMTALFATVAMAAIDGNPNDGIKYEIHNGDKLISLSNKPLIYGDSYYLPLRETLNAFNITDIKWDNGTINISMPDANRTNRIYVNNCEITVGNSEITYKNGNIQKGDMQQPPILKSGVVYVTEHFFSDLIRVGQIPQYKFNAIRDLSPESYYTSGEEVFIGTLEEQEQFEPSGNGHLVKRIIVDENRNTVAVIPVENQKPEKITLIDHNDKVSANNYTGMFKTSLFNMAADGRYVYKNSDILVWLSVDSDTIIAYIPTIWQINIPKEDY